MKVSDYLPDLYEHNLEMINIINSEEIELENNIKPDIEELFNNNFVTTATETGIAKFEKILNITPAPDDTVEFRKERILLRLSSEIPFTETYLINRLNAILGKDNWTYEINYNNYSLTITSIVPGKNWKNELLSLLNKIIPCNISWSVQYYEASWGIVYNHFTTWEDVFTEGTWQDIIDGEYIS